MRMSSYSQSKKERAFTYSNIDKKTTIDTIGDNTC